MRRWVTSDEYCLDLTARLQVVCIEKVALMSVAASLYRRCVQNQLSTLGDKQLMSANSS